MWIGAGNNVDKMEVFLLLLSSAHTEPKLWLLLIDPTIEGAGGAQGVGRGHRQAS